MPGIEEIHRYSYPVKVVSVYDGDTITVDIDLGLNAWLRGQKLRLYGIDTPELRGADRERGLAVRDYVREALASGSPVYIQTHKDRTGKYGRWLAVVFYRPPAQREYVNLNQELIERGMARPYMAD